MTDRLIAKGYEAQGCYPECESGRHPCPYHEGWQDAVGVLDELEEMGDDLVCLTAENASLRDQLARETALRIAAEQRAEAMAW